MLPKFSVKRPYTILVGVVMVLVLGYVSLTKMTADLLPSMNFNYAIVMTTYPGASPETVENAVTRPLEAQMASLSNIVSVSSVSNDNYSMVILEFTETADMNAATVDMRESLDQLTNVFPEGVGRPLIMKINPDMLPVMTAAVDAEGLSQAELTRFVQTEIVPAFERIEGVASVSVSGDVTESIQVILRQDRIDKKNAEIRAALDKKFEDGQKELDDARGKIEDGQKELDEKKDQAASQMSDGLAQIVGGRAGLLKGEQEIRSKLSELDSAKAQLEQGKTQLAAGKAELENRKNQWTLFSPLLGTVADGLEALEEAGVGEEELNDLIEQALSGLTEEQRAALTAMVGDIPLSADAVRKMASDIDTQIAEGEAQLAKAGAELASGEAQLESGRQILEKTLAQLEGQEVSLDKALAALNQGQILAGIEISGAQSQLTSALAGIEAAQAQMDQAKDTAYTQADLNKVLSADTIRALLTAQNFSMPAGSASEDGESYLVRVGDRVKSAKELETLPLMNLHLDGVDAVVLGDVADIIVSNDAASKFAVINGNPGIILTMDKQTGYSTGDVSKKIVKVFGELEKRHPGTHLTALLDQGVYIDLVIDSVVKNMLVGGLLAILVLILFLRNFRPTLIIACSIPLSVVTAVALMYFSGITLNVISLGGLALGIGMLVDNSIVVIENIYRMRAEEGKTAREAAVEGAREVAGAIIASTLTTVVVFLPIVFVEGITKQLFVDMGLTIAYSLLASLIIALSLVPAMAAGLLKKEQGKKSRISLAVERAYGKILGGALRVRVLVVLLSVALLAGSGLAAISRGTAFLPDMQSTQASVTMRMPVDAEFEEVKKTATELISRLEKLPDVTTVGAMAGGSGLMNIGGLGGGGGRRSQSVSMYLILDEKRSLDNIELKDAILTAGEDLPCDLDVTTSTMDMSALGGSGISVRIKGRDLEKLRDIAADVAQILRETEGTMNVSDGMENAEQQLKITVDKESAGEYNLTVAQVFSAVMGALSQEVKATTIETDTQDLSVTLIEGEKQERTRKEIRDLTVTVKGADGTESEVPLSRFVTFESSKIQSSIRREDQSRYMTVSASIDDTHNIGLVAADVTSRLSSYEVPDGYTVEMAGEDSTINDAMSELMKMLALSVIFVYLVMVAQFQSLLSPFIVMFTIPLAFTGGFLALFVTGNPVSVISMLGFVMLAGIIVNNGIVLVDYMNQLRSRGIPKRQAILEGCKTRLRPVFMTALTTVLALSTMAFGTDLGAEMTRPLAIVVIGGLAYGTLLTLLVVPCIYDLMTRKDKPQEAPEVLPEGTPAEA
ncbi:MAG: efflux RND transporter permease subunit [Lachnospiraceae bacterium]|nr:efflux RND transporter permease subunit [Lachnospiraceae bacterium]